MATQSSQPLGEFTSIHPSIYTCFQSIDLFGTFFLTHFKQCFYCKNHTIFCVCVFAGLFVLYCSTSISCSYVCLSINSLLKISKYLHMITLSTYCLPFLRHLFVCVLVCRVFTRLSCALSFYNPKHCQSKFLYHQHEISG